MSASSQSTELEKTPVENASVYCADGERLGIVRSVRGGYFEIDVRMEGDFWLSNAYIASADDSSVRLSISHQEVDEHRLSAPGIDASTDANRAVVEDRVISDEEALSQRERMERELAEQRARLARERGESA